MKTMNEQQEAPHATEAERGILGSCLMSPAEALNFCEERKVTPEWFYDLRHGLVWKTLQELAEKGLPVDLVTVVDALGKASLLEQVGGVAYLAELADAVPSAANLPAYVELVEDSWVLRRVIVTCKDVEGQARECDGKVEEFVDRVAQDFARVAEGSSQLPGTEVRPVVRDLIDEAEKYHRGGAQITGLVTTGLSYLDKQLCGLGGANGNLIILTGRPGTGKTSLGMQVAMQVACDFKWGPGEADKGWPVVVFSMEMAAHPLVKRAWFQRAGVDMQRWRTGFANEADFAKLTKAGVELAKAPLHVDDESSLSIDVLRARARRYHRTLGAKLFVVDYIQLMRVSSRRRDGNRAYELEEISHGLQALGKELQVPIIVLAQMNRDSEKREGKAKRPQLADLKDSGAIEQDADVVLMLYDGEKHMSEKQAEEWEEAKATFGKDWSMVPKPVNALIAKNRYGPSNKDVELVFHAGCTRFEDRGDWLKGTGVRSAAKGEKKRVELDLPEEGEE